MYVPGWWKLTNQATKNVIMQYSNVEIPVYLLINDQEVSKGRLLWLAMTITLALIITPHYANV